MSCIFVRMKNLYLLSGLGADKRVFEFLDLTEYTITHVVWIKPLELEPIENYATRLLSQINTRRPILLGVSFGGMMAIELGKLIETEKIILVSSIKTRSDLPTHMKLAGRLGLTKSIPNDFVKKTNALLFFLFGVSEPSEKKLLTAILQDTDIEFLKWGINQIVHWKNETQLEHIVQIHGTSDRIFPIKKPEFAINKGGHLMIINCSKEISVLLRKIIDNP